MVLARWGLVAALAGLAGSAGCASRYKLEAEPPTYAAQAKIKVKVNKTGNRQMDVDVQHLAPPSKLPGGYQTYAVWIRVPGHGLSKAGFLDYDSKHRRGRLLATTPHAKFEVLVSLERDRAAQQPSEIVILREVVGA